MKPVLYPILQNANAHERDAHIQFFEDGHKYIITTDPDSTYTSVTTWNHSHFEKFDADKIIHNMMRSKSWKPGHKYWGLTADQIKASWSSNIDAQLGTDLHFQIECFMNNPECGIPYTHRRLLEAARGGADTVEWSYFLEFVRDFPDLKPYRTEWTIYDEDVKIAGSIDMVYEHEDGSLSIYDWKRSKQISKINGFNKYAVTPEISQFPDSNYWHYALQLNTYKYILQKKYGKRVRDLFLVRLHPDAEEKSYELIAVHDLSREVAQLFAKRAETI
jgi:ATP-dependent exoDNAse (exonuclease V) beta subunit